MSAILYTGQAHLEAAIKGQLGASELFSHVLDNKDATRLTISWDMSGSALRRVSDDSRKFTEHIAEVMRELSSRIAQGEVHELRTEVKALREKCADLQRYKMFYEMGR